ncbi:mandelate racemase/muconate lactonizing enzyme family protein [Paraburkholderia sp. UCT2]|uniref:mandelate racemase/muconate lactonizing enzyme family protein n=1 Tax=Paraburkholderia sp. UCT2 TaxID=2615208 RepID=UPI0016559C2E|nr:mandelate racemase/muconate lactonizing enzyme family protein [Paraburkholderia sp. UCT2]
MKKEARIDSLTLSIVQVTPSTRWAFVEMVDDQNRTGFGEATLAGHDGDLLRVASELFAAVVNTRLKETGTMFATLRLETLARAAVVSALSHATMDLLGQARNCSAAALLGEIVRESVPMYANINRRTRSRAPADFAQSARVATAAGFSAVKIAPFDDVALYGAHTNYDKKLIDAALDRIAAVRDIVGRSVEVMVDCHWRLNVAVAREVLASNVCDGLYWLECPIPESPDNLQDLRALRSFANSRGIRLAGCEQAVRTDGFRPFVKAGAYDVMMPDIKYVGGMGEMLEVARLLDSHGVEFSPHNPSGPVAHAASLQICALVPNFRRLEMQFNETRYFDAIANMKLPLPQNGKTRVSSAPGLGIEVNRTELDSLTIRRLIFNREHEKCNATVA